MFSNRLLAQMGVLFKTEVVHVFMQLALQQNLNPRLAAKCKPPPISTSPVALVSPPVSTRKSLVLFLTSLSTFNRYDSAAIRLG